MKTAIIGAGGIIGQHLRLCIPEGMECVWTRRKPDLLHVGLDVTTADAIYAFLDEHKPDCVINLAGENRTDVVEYDPTAYHAVNVVAPARMASWCRDAGAHMIQVSSQAVFGVPASPSDIPFHPLSERRPVNAYGQQKLEAEIAVRAINPDATIVRPSFVLGVRPLPLVGRENPVERWLSPPKLALEGETIGQLREVNNRWFSCSFAWDVAQHLWAAVTEPRHRVANIGIPYRVSRYDLARYLRGDVEAVNHEDFPGIAQRPLDTTYAGKGEWATIQAGLSKCRAFYESRECLGLDQRAQELSIFTGVDVYHCGFRLSLGFGSLHNAVTDDFRRSNPQGDAELLDWYRKTDAYIWELSAYHLDPGFNYMAMCGGIAAALKAKGCSRVLCLGDGIGDLTLVLQRAGLDPAYHDLRNSRTADFAALRLWMYGQGKGGGLETDGFLPLFSPDSFEAVVSLDFLEHVPNVEDWLRAIYAALKPGGWFVAQNAFGMGSGPDGSMPMHLACNDRWETDYDPFLAELGFKQDASNWYQK